jgi:hypothetical protein
LDDQSTQDEEDVDANTGADEDSEDESELSEVESEFEYEQNEEMNDILSTTPSIFGGPTESLLDLICRHSL